jgi:hypothetical protein
MNKEKKKPDYDVFSFLNVELNSAYYYFVVDKNKSLTGCICACKYKKDAKKIADLLNNDC